jgi:hypothetical protein
MEKKRMETAMARMRQLLAQLWERGTGGDEEMR